MVSTYLFTYRVIKLCVMLDTVMGITNSDKSTTLPTFIIPYEIFK
jgi:hypothetical protein